MNDNRANPIIYLVLAEFFFVIATILMVQTIMDDKSLISYITVVLFYVASGIQVATYAVSKKNR